MNCTQYFYGSFNLNKDNLTTFILSSKDRRVLLDPLSQVKTNTSFNESILGKLFRQKKRPEKLGNKERYFTIFGLRF